MAQQQTGPPAGGKKKRRQFRHRGKRAVWRQRSFEHVQARRKAHRLRHPLDKELEKAVRWIRAK